jgi:hypothetical protein
MNLDDHYLIWQLVASKRAYVVHRFDDAFLKRVSGSLTGIWPASAFCVMTAETGVEDPVLPDSLFNTDRRLFISPRLKSFLEKAAVSDIEYWPIKVMDRTGRPLSEPYFFVHLMNGPDCLDLEASGATRSRMLPRIAEKIARLEFKSDPDRALYRPGTFSKVALVSWALAEKLASEKFSGFRFMGLFDYGIHGDLPPNPKRHAVDALCARLNQ